jgi:hypothetical protein
MFDDDDDDDDEINGGQSYGTCNANEKLRSV